MIVRNLQESIEFYRELFGFEIRKEQPEQDSVIIGNDTVKLCIYEDPGLEIGEGISHFGFHVENFNDIITKCQEMNISMPYGTVPWEHSRSVYIIDPSGYEIELSEIAGGGL
tara:strand:- start:718 stop:1053 length:336 start_codon:yes stop_codon:yes gene_type:complete